MLGKLFVIATPIGNLSDITQRAVETIKTLDVLFCEDTRQTAKLLSRLEVRVPLDSYREQAHATKAAKIVAFLSEGKNIGLVSDAGTPGVSDPGSRLIEAVTEKLPEAVITPIPGPSAVVSLVSISGFPGDGFLFMGFPPHKKGRNAFVREALDSSRTTVLYESPHRISRLLNEIASLAPDRRLCVGRELTKMHETIYRGTAAEVTELLARTSAKGEFVMAIERNRGRASSNEALREDEIDE